jgi:hypothetical protein
MDDLRVYGPCAAEGFPEHIETVGRLIARAMPIIGKETYQLEDLAPLVQRCCVLDMVILLLANAQTAIQLGTSEFEIIHMFQVWANNERADGG